MSGSSPSVRWIASVSAPESSSPSRGVSVIRAIELHRNPSAARSIASSGTSAA